MSSIRPVEIVRYWRPDGLPGVEILHEYGSERPCAYFFETYTLAAALDIHAAARYRRNSYTLMSGAVHLGEPGELYATIRQYRPCSIQVVRLDTVVVEAFIQELDLVGHPHFRLSHTTDGDVYTALIHFQRSLLNGSSLLEQQTRMFETLRLILSRYAEFRLTTRTPPIAPSAVNRAREYLHAHWNENVTLHDLADVIGQSKCHLVDSFRHTFGLPPHTYQTYLRIAHAQQLLAQGHNIAYVAQETGFADQAHLTRHFRRRLGITPGEYAKNRKIVQDVGSSAT
jgi:AraC-like DNA-binding protein